MSKKMKHKEPEIIINSVEVGKGCAMTIRVALEVFMMMYND